MKIHAGVIAAVSALGLSEAAQNQTLQPWALQPLPLGTIKPRGWLRDQMGLMAEGLAGHEHDFYKYVTESPFMGGEEEYSELHEAFPYWFNGLVPLAYGLNDERLKDQVRSAADYILEHQAEDGWIGPETGTQRNIWARMPLLLGMVQLAEAEPDYETKIVDAMYKYSTLTTNMLKDDFQGYKFHVGDETSEGDTIWARVRYQDNLLVLQWLDEVHPRGSAEKAMLWDNMNLLVEGGEDWSSWFSDEKFIKEDLNLLPATDTDPLFGFVHNVNLGQGLKATGVIHRFTHDASLAESARHGVDLTYTYHTAASGAILGDERLAGLSPFYGSELCGVVETMYSLTILQQILGDSQFADRAELTTFNALPAMATGDWWAHQYVAQPNQPFAHHLVDPATGEEGTPFWNVGAWGQTFGLEPQYPCCTVNHPQGYPKYLAAMFTKLGGSGPTIGISSTLNIAHSLLGPAEASIPVDEGVVSIACDTNYPFSNTLTYTIDTPSAFTLSVRVPSWADAKASSLQIGDGGSTATTPDGITGLTSVDVPKGKSTVTYKIAPQEAITVEQRANDTVAVHAGRLLYALALDADPEATHPPKIFDGSGSLPEDYAPAESQDVQFENTTAWAVAIDPSTLTFRAGDTEAPLANPVFDFGAPPSYIEVQGCEIPWNLYHNVPDAPVTGDARACTSDVATYRLAPYGSTKIRMVDLPTLDLSGAGGSKKGKKRMGGNST